MISPVDLGAPSRFLEWQPYQWEALSAILDSPKKFIGLCMPTGAGKSLVGMMAGILSSRRTVYLVSTKALQDQLQADFGGISVDVRGQANYPCLKWPGDSVAEARCHVGYRCDMRDAGCVYYDLVRDANRSQLTVTNYAFYLSVLSVPEQARFFAPADVLVMDEGHLVVDELTRHLQVELYEADMSRLGIAWPRLTGSVVEWAKWAREEYGKVVRPTNLSPRQMIAWNGSKDKLAKLKERITACPENWIIAEENGRSHRWTFTPIWPMKNKLTVYDAPSKVVVMSATLTPKAMELAGMCATGDFEFHEYPSSIGVERRRVWYIPTMAMSRAKVSDIGISFWASRIDQILDKRPGVKAIIHTTSYQRTRQLAVLSRQDGRLLTHGAGELPDVLDKFRKSDKPLALASPILTHGYDFKGDECRVVIVGKLPYPSAVDPLNKARAEADKEWVAHQVMMVVVQSAGRATRGTEDWSETFIIDDDWRWFSRRYTHLAPKWFMEAVERSDTIPEPPNAGGGP